MSVTTIIWTIVIGFLAGIIARFLKPGRDPMGFILTTVLGIAGAFLGTFVGRALGFYAGGQVAGFIVSVIGAIVLLVLWGLFSKRR